MDCKSIKFAQEFCFNSILESAENSIHLGLIDYQVPRDDLFLMTTDKGFARVTVEAKESLVLSELHNSYGRALLRVDRINGDHIALTLLKFSDELLYDENNPLNIIVDHAVDSDLRNNNFEIEKAVNEITRQLIVEEGEKYAFAYSSDSTSGNLELIGDRYTFTVAETPQNYLHIIRIRKRSNRDRIDSPIVMLRGSISIINELNDNAKLTEKADKQYKKLINSDADFISLWNIYNELELESNIQYANEMGMLRYEKYHYANGMIVFSLMEGYTRREFCVDNMYYVAIDSINKEKPMDYNTRSAIIIGTEIDPSCINTKEFRIKEEMDTTRIIPKRGYLLPSISGSKVQNKRRKIAQNNILSNQCQLPGLKNIIQGGALVGSIGRKNQPISSGLEIEVFSDKNQHFTEKQKRALDVAINTPDMAIIQGPPGTGKTTVIRAIVKRIDELWKSKAKILITSTQHDAVDNAIEKIDYGGVPVNRVSIRRGRDSENSSIYDWIDRMIESCEEWIDKYGGRKKSTVRTLLKKLVEVESIKDFSRINDLLSECFEMMKTMNISPELTTKFGRIMAEVSIRTHDSNIIEENELIQLLYGQRTNKAAFLDDGISQLKLLERYLKFNSDLDYDIPKYWKKLKRITSDCQELDDYLVLLKADCDKLLDLYNDGVIDDSLIEKDIKELIEDLRNELLLVEDDSKTLLINMIWEFKQRMTNISNVEQLIKAYSKINAATCQQAANPKLSLSMAGFDEEYDFVIIDEAARSNPLDLLIPMSMGHRIILVGDHKQLPHMVERDVVQSVMEKTKTDKKKVEAVLEESLFMRLYESISREDKKLGIARTAMLSEQYRMHPDICDLVNVFYEGKLETMCKREAKEHNLGLYDNKALVWIDMPLSEEFPEETKRHSISRDCEVERIRHELGEILTSNESYTVGIISFYSAQARLLNDMVQKCYPGDLHRIRVGTVDAFQGKEFDVVLLSIVRCNREEDMRRRVGFLDNNNRLCVAFSRAKRLLIAVGDSRTVAKDGERIYVQALNEMFKKCQIGA